MATVEQRGILRLRYRRRQLLAGDDLRREVADPTELQWWHNRALHDGFGVVQGLAVRLLETGSATVAGVAPGLAYDAYGRPLVLERPIAIGLPARRSGGVLLLRARQVEGRSTTGHGGAGAPPAAVELCWAGPGHVAARDGVPIACLSAVALAELPVDAAALPDGIVHAEDAGELRAIGRLGAVELEAALALAKDEGDDGQERYRRAVRALVAASQACRWPRRSRPLARARVASGMTIPGETPWQPWLITTPWPLALLFSLDTASVQIGFQVRIDVSAAGFAATPRYFAWLQGPLYELPESGRRTGGVHWSHVDEAGPDGFTFRTSVLTEGVVPGIGLGRDPQGRPLAGTQSDVLRVLREKGFCVSWLAMEPGPPVEPAPAEGRIPQPRINEVSDGHVR